MFSYGGLVLVRAAGVEPASHAWEAHIIPIYYARTVSLTGECLVRPGVLGKSKQEGLKYSTTGASTAVQMKLLPIVRLQVGTVWPRTLPDHLAATFPQRQLVYW